MTRQYVCGATTDSPQNGQTTFTAEFLKECFVNFLIINNVPENQLNPSPDFTHNYLEGKITRGNPWVTGDKLIIDYTPCKCIY